MPTTPPSRKSRRPVRVRQERSANRSGQPPVGKGAGHLGDAVGPVRRLSPVDAAFLYLERKEIPLAIASLNIFDGEIPFHKFVARVESKLPLVPRYRQIVEMPAWNLDLPVWKADPHFDIRRHMFRIRVDPPGGDAELEALAGRIFSQTLDRARPLWEIYVIDGLKGGRGAMIFRLHHALADGVSGAGLMKVILDTTPEGAPARRQPRSQPLPAPVAERSLLDKISSAVQSTLRSAFAAEMGLLGFAQTLLPDRMESFRKSLPDLLPELALPVERLPFNKPCGGDRKFCWAEFDLAEVKAIREKVGGTLNDVVLTVLTRALARYVKLHGQTTVKRFVRIVCPVSLRHGADSAELGNLLSFMPVALPMDVRDPAQMLRAVAARTETMKHAGAAQLVLLIAACIAAAPAPLQALFWWGLPELILPAPLLNMICTNVPGPDVPLYAVGRRMLASYPQVPTGYDLGVNVAVETYDGKLFFGLIADADVASDVNRLRDFLYTSFGELHQAAVAPVGAKKARRPTARTRRAARASKPEAGVAAPPPASEPPPVAATGPPLMKAKDAA
ncbi:MAG: wax ester/triacylglycerol synthase family O-acyltransferase [Terriglobia bacterium]